MAVAAAPTTTTTTCSSANGSHNSGVGAHKRFIHSLVEQSRERVAQVRAGQSLSNVFEQPSVRSQPHQQQQQPQLPSPFKKKETRATQQPHDERAHTNDKNNGALPHIAPTMALVYAARRQAGVSAVIATKRHEPLRESSAMHKYSRLRDAVEPLVPAATILNNDTESQPASACRTSKSNSIDPPPSYLLDSSAPTTTFQAYVDSKSERVETLRQSPRRKAIVSSTRQMAQLAALTLANQPPPPMQQSPSPSRSPQQQPSIPTDPASLLSTLAAVKGKNAFLKGLAHHHDATATASAATASAAAAVDVLPPQPSPLPHVASNRNPHVASNRNPHFAFLDFRRTSDERSNRESAVHTCKAINVDESNATTNAPIHFGDQICFISAASNLPLSIGRDGRAKAATSPSVSKHMRFTIIDFRNPSRRSAVSMDDEFWLQVDASLLKRRTRVFATDDTEDDDSDSDADDRDVSNLVSATHYYLGCAGSIEDTLRSSHAAAFDRTSHTHGPARRYVLPASSNRSNSSSNHYKSDTFRLVAIKAIVPRTEYYGDDAVTREYTIETNESAMRLARWRFTLHKPVAMDTDDDAARLLLHCATMYLTLNDFVLESDALRHHRGVMRDVRTSTKDATVLDVVQLLHRRGSDHAAAASWQVRLLRRGQRSGIGTATSNTVAARSPNQPRTSSLGKSAGVQQQSQTFESSPAEWLKQQHDAVARTTAHIRDKQALASTAKQSYARVAAQSNAKLVEIETHKATHQRAYFQTRYHALFAHEQQGQRDSAATKSPELSQRRAAAPLPLIAPS